MPNTDTNNMFTDTRGAVVAFLRVLSCSVFLSLLDVTLTVQQAGSALLLAVVISVSGVLSSFLILSGFVPQWQQIFSKL
jgi:hypothetical protein